MPVFRQIFDELVNILLYQKVRFFRNNWFLTKFSMLHGCSAKLINDCCLNYPCFIKKCACMHQCNMLKFQLCSTRVYTNKIASPLNILKLVLFQFYCLFLTIKPPWTLWKVFRKKHNLCNLFCNCDNCDKQKTHCLVHIFSKIFWSGFLTLLNTYWKIFSEINAKEAKTNLDNFSISVQSCGEESTFVFMGGGGGGQRIMSNRASCCCLISCPCVSIPWESTRISSQSQRLKAKA